MKKPTLRESDRPVLAEIVRRWKRTGGGTIVPLQDDKRLKVFNRLAESKFICYLGFSGNEMICAPISAGFQAIRRGPKLGRAVAGLQPSH